MVHFLILICLFLTTLGLRYFCRISLVPEIGELHSSHSARVLNVVASLPVEHGAPGFMGFSSCSVWAQKWLTGLAAPWHMGSSQTKDQILVPCISRWILNHWATREVRCVCVKEKESRSLSLMAENNKVSKGRVESVGRLLQSGG